MELLGPRGNELCRKAVAVTASKAGRDRPGAQQTLLPSTLQSPMGASPWPMPAGNQPSGEHIGASLVDTERQKRLEKGSGVWV